MASITSEMLRDRALPTLRALFTAYDAEEKSQAAWIACVLEKHPEIEASGNAGFLREAFRDQLYTLAGCLVVVGDGLIKASAVENLDGSPGRTRRHFGTIVAGDQHFGAVLQAGGNAFRHSSEWLNPSDVHPATAAVLKNLGISADEATCYNILQLAGINDFDSFVNAIDATCQDIETGVPCQACDHPASWHRREGDSRGSGCSFHVNIMDGLRGPIAAVTAAVIVRGKTGRYNCKCRMPRRAVVDAWLKNGQPTY